MTKANAATMSTTARADADRRRAVLRELLKRHGIRPAELARRAGLLRTNTIYNFLNGHSSSLSQSTIEKIVASFADGSADGLIIRPVVPLTTTPRNRPAPPGIVVVPVIAETKQGVRQPASILMQKDPVTICVPAALVQNRPRLFGVRVGRPGGELLYAHGSVLICTAMATLHPPLKDGWRVVVTETHDDGIEVSIRRVQVHQSGSWLWPDTDEPRQQRPLLAPKPTDTAKNGDITIVGRVIATLQPEPSPDD